MIWISRYARSFAWHRWFAWRPVVLDDGSNRTVWLQHVWRRRCGRPLNMPGGPSRYEYALGWADVVVEKDADDD